MNTPIRHRPHHLRNALGAIALGSLALLVSDAHGDSAVQFMTAKSLPDATVAVIDPESGTSTGTGGSDVNIAVGDIILFRFAVASAPSSGSSVTRGIQSYVTEYVPPGTVLVGARLTDAFGNTIEPRPAGLALDGCAGGGLCNTPPGGRPSGSIAQVYADTGIFFSTALLSGSPIPVNQFLTLNNGVTMTEKPRDIDPSIVQVLNDVAGPWFAHNDWDYDQLLAFGAASSTVANGGDGNTPFGYGSAVAGPQTHYPYEINANGTLTDTIGPWNRVLYPGSQIGTGVGNIGSTTNMTRVGVATATGFDLKPRTPASATAVRFALGEAQVGELRFVEVALRVTSVPIDPSFGTAAGNVDCGEVFGTDASSRAANSGGANNPWPTFVPHPQCVFLRLKFDIQVDKDLALGSDFLDYDIFGKNLAVTTETNARVVVKYVSSDQSFISSTPAPSSSAACTAPGETDRTCLTWNLGALAPSDEFAIDLRLSSAPAGKRTAVVLAQYLSNELVAIDARGFTSTAMTVVAPTAAPRITLSNALDVTSNFAAAGSNTWQVNGTVTNAGTTDWTSGSFTLVLPDATWGLRNAGGTAADQITVGGVNFNCTNAGIERVCNRADTYPITGATQTRTIGFRVVVPAGAAGLYTLGIRTFGDAFETNFPKAITIPVGAVRTARPILACPIAATQPAITGTSEAGAAIRVLFNLMQRGTATATVGGTWSASDFTDFGERYGGLEVTATAEASPKLRSEPSTACFITPSRECSDGFDNDGDLLIDFPADPGCTTPLDSSETNPVPPQCSNGIDDDGVGGIDFPFDQSCTDPADTTETGGTGCADGLDNDGDGLIDFDGPGPANPDPDCADAADGTEQTLRQCQDGLDNDLDGDIDFGPAASNDTECHSAFDDDEGNSGGSSTADAKARLLIALDSSGSMNWNTCDDVFTGGDGSTECAGGDVACATCNGGSCGNTEPDDSRLYQVKSGLSNVVAAFGEIEYALMRFHQKPETFSCPGPAAGLRSGGWQGGGASPCGGGFAAGDLLVSFDQDNEPTILDWMNHDDDYPGTAPYGTDFEVRGSGTTPLAGILTSANTYLDAVRASDLKAACRPYRVILVTDGAETCGGDPRAAALALFNDGAEVTVIGFATDDPAVIANLNGIADAADGTIDNIGTATFVDDEAALSAAIGRIISESILVEKCNNADDDCDGRTDEDFPDVLHRQVPPLPPAPDDPPDSCDNGQIGFTSVTAVNGVNGACNQPGVFECVPIGLDPSQTTTRCNAPLVLAGTEVCNQQDDDCDGETDENLVGCICLAQAETCNGRDDDCDAAIDEEVAGVGDACGFSQGLCLPGHFECTPTGPGTAQLTCEDETGPFTEVCNGDDDNCNGLTDELFEECYEPADAAGIGCDPDGAGGFTCLGLCASGGKTCAGNALGSCEGDVHPVTDVCNGFDDDCDGAADEGLTYQGIPLGEPCNNGLLGLCAADGVVACAASGSTFCTAPVIPPGLESCNAIDDDCDGAVDDNLGLPIGTPCGTCGGTFQCVPTGPTDPTPIECVGSGTCCTTEVCDGVDNDCDGVADDEVPGFGGTCVPLGAEAYQDIGECAFGHLECVGGVSDCRDYVGPSAELPCNGIDEDCDGLDDVTCPGPLACTPGGCASPCGPGEFPCSFGFYCEEFDGLGRFCIEDPCADANCAPGFACDQATGDCYDLCDGVNCPTGTTCTNGQCRDCFTLGCPDGEICVQDGGTQLGVCEVDACATVTCDVDQFCRDGDCVALPTEPCPAGCPDGQVCDEEEMRCTTDQCVGVTCTDGEACNPFSGECIPDPCRQINCPVGTECVINTDGSGACREPLSPPEETIFAGGGGCGCTTGSGGPDGGGILLAIGLALGLARRRRRTVRGAASQ